MITCSWRPFTGPDASVPHLFFANAEAFRDRIAALAEEDPLSHGIVLNLETVSFLDTGGADALTDITSRLRDAGIVLAVARLNREGREVLERAGVVSLIGCEQFYSSVEDAVGALGSKPH